MRGAASRPARKRKAHILQVPARRLMWFDNQSNRRRAVTQRKVVIADDDLHGAIHTMGFVRSLGVRSRMGDAERLRARKRSSDQPPNPYCPTHGAGLGENRALSNTMFQLVGRSGRPAPRKLGAKGLETVRRNGGADARH